MHPNDWRNSQDYYLQERRQSFLSCFIRNKVSLEPDVYEFVDLLISQGYQIAETEKMDKFIIDEYHKYSKTRLYIRDYDDDGYPD
ncbi:hypothetical protein [Synechococcus phage S-H38]|uniref:Uncharacterized protein n=1 Tax=Synechococcus phage S-H38 TaxID=2783673 RepID=A0A873WGH1_9CAUD|nr:hypothetical protein PQC14_gp029 [Synechococcus phage S-H38]QPB08032.1 hypothetical protein [Synechococcus phage S-H38]